MRNALAVTLLRVWAATQVVWAVYSIVAGIFLVFVSPPDPHDDMYLRSNLMADAIYFGVALFAWVIAPPLAATIGRAVGGAQEVISIDPRIIVAIGSFLVGVYLFAQFSAEAVTKTAIAAFRAVNASNSEQAFASGLVVFYDLEGLAKAWLAAGLSLLIAFRARDLGRLFGWLREAGLRKPELEKA